MTVTAPPRPPVSMPPTSAPPTDPRDPQTDPEALIEEARRRAQRRRRLYGASVLLAAAIGAGGYFGSGRGEGGLEAGAPLAAEKPLVRIEAGSTASTMSNGPLAIVAFDANGVGEGPDGWYGLSNIGLGGRLSPVAPCPGRTTWCGEVESIDWSPDGKRLALSVTSFGRANAFNGVHVVNPATGRDQQIVNCLPPECDWLDLDWSPDGSRLAFVSVVGGRSNGSISLINTDGTGRTFLETPTGGRDSSPSWSPNGNWIAYAGVDEDGSAVYAIRADGSQARLLARHGSGPAWSPDGQKIAYQTKCGVKLITPSGSDVTPPSALKCNAMGVPGLGPPVWSPNGRQIAISGQASTPDGATRSGTYIMNADGSNLVRLTEESLSVHVGQKPRPAWQPVR
jgi:WD40-like Beta Propeller Repeat